VLGAGADAIVWYSSWDDARAADRFAEGLKRGWTKRRAGQTPRRWEITRLAVGGRPVVRLIDAPAAWKGWKNVPRVRIR